MARRQGATLRRHLVLSLGLLVGVGACGQLLQVSEYEVVEEDGAGGTDSGGTRSGGVAGDVGLGGRHSGGSEPDSGGSAGSPAGGTGGTSRGGAAGETGGGTGGSTGGTGATGGQVLAGGAAGRVAGGAGGASGGTSGGEGGTTGGISATGGAPSGGAGGTSPVCDPLDPVPVCGAGSRCIPQRDATAPPTCVEGVGVRETYRYCARIENCQANLTCVQITPDEPADPNADPPFPGNSDSSVCVQWCRVGHAEDCAGATEQCFRLASPRHIGSQEWGICTPPDPPPDALYEYEPPPGWICDPSYWGQDGYCDCGCEVFDPDCSSDTVTFDGGCNCAVPSCGNDGSNFGCTPRVDTTNNALCSEWNWTCPASYWGDNDCDCGCGEVDVDCSSASPTVCSWCGTGSCAATNPPGSCDTDLLDPNDSSICL